MVVPIESSKSNIIIIHPALAAKNFYYYNTRTSFSLGSTRLYVEAHGFEKPTIVRLIPEVCPSVPNENAVLVRDESLVVIILF